MPKFKESYLIELKKDEKGDWWLFAKDANAHDAIVEMLKQRKESILGRRGQRV